MLLEVEGADTEIAALGLAPTPEERIAAKLMERYAGDEVTGGTYFVTREIVESEEFASLVDVGPAPAYYLALAGSSETFRPGGWSDLETEWKLLVRLPERATHHGMASLTRLRLLRRFRALTIGENIGSLENDEEPSRPLTDRLSAWDHADAPDFTAGQDVLRTVVGFRFQSKIDSRTGEV